MMFVPVCRRQRERLSWRGTMGDISGSKSAHAVRSRIEAMLSGDRKESVSMPIKAAWGMKLTPEEIRDRDREFEEACAELEREVRRRLGPLAGCARIEYIHVPV